MFHTARSVFKQLCLMARHIFYVISFSLINDKTTGSGIMTLTVYMLYSTISNPLFTSVQRTYWTHVFVPGKSYLTLDCDSSCDSRVGEWLLPVDSGRDRLPGGGMLWEEPELPGRRVGGTGFQEGVACCGRSQSYQVGGWAGQAPRGWHAVGGARTTR